ncbi:hypothetical protein A6C13_23095 [Salmonella enterica]|nr:hypothetical protein [Salmonella enterica]
MLTSVSAVPAATFVNWRSAPELPNETVLLRFATESAPIAMAPLLADAPEPITILLAPVAVEPVPMMVPFRAFVMVLPYPIIIP